MIEIEIKLGVSIQSAAMAMIMLRHVASGKIVLKFNAATIEIEQCDTINSICAKYDYFLRSQREAEKTNQ